MTIKHLFPPSKPTVDLNFAAERALDPRITFTRFSTGTYVDASGIVQTAVNDEPRFDHDPETGESLGLLIEVSRTNTFLNSSDCALWEARRSSTGTDTGVITAPDGSNSVGWFENSIGSQGSQLRGGTVTAGDVPSSLFVWLKARSGSPWVAVGPGQPGAQKENVFFNLSTGEKGQRGSALVGDVDIVPWPNGWYKIVFTGVTPVNLVNSLTIWAADYDGQSDEEYTILSSYYCWGAQVEDAASFPTSYIATAGATATRAVDLADITGTNFSGWYNQSEGTFTIDLPTPLTSIFNNDIIFSTNAGLSGTENVMLQWVGTPYWKASSAQVATAPVKGSDAVTGKYAMAWDSSTIGAATDGYAAVTTTSGTVLTTATTLNIFAGGAGSRPVYGHIARLSYYPTRLPDEQLEALSS